MEALLVCAALVVVVVVWLMIKANPDITPFDDAGVRHPADEVEEVIEDLLDDVDLMQLTKKELISMAEAKGVAVTSRMKKADIVAQLK